MFGRVSLVGVSAQELIHDSLGQAEVLERKQALHSLLTQITDQNLFGKVQQKHSALLYLALPNANMQSLEWQMAIQGHKEILDFLHLLSRAAYNMRMLL